MIKLTREEQETHFYMDAVSNDVFCDSTVPKDIKKLKRQGWIQLNETLYPDGSVMAAKFKAPRSCLTLRLYNPEKPKRTLSPEHKEKILSALKKSRENK